MPDMTHMTISWAYAFAYMDYGVVFALSSVTGDDHDTGSPRLPEGGVINCNGNGILNQNQVNRKYIWNWLDNL